ncbi:MAG: TIGR04283 family arsenosugar biosynthesis glycosyltransferase [Deltaproteobacteria bacterium]|nr:TIGR04283 family arsenosugar biosynthesis glycosyltransferase [Candidatus Anaeroferrophillacea bacterium]
MPAAAGREGFRVSPALSVVIPALDEEHHLGATLAALDYAPWQELVVADGGSRDDTVAVAREYGARVLVVAAGRGGQLNAGAAAAAGSRLLFLHADTRLPAGWAAAACRLLDEPGVAAGCFALRIDASDPRLRLVEAGVDLRTRLARLPYGDQGLFMYRRFFAAAGGYPDQPIMEDVALARRLRRLGRIVQLPLPAYTSARRWQRLGVLRTTLVNRLILSGSALGVKPETLAAWYRGDFR